MVNIIESLPAKVREHLQYVSRNAVMSVEHGTSDYCRQIGISLWDYLCCVCDCGHLKAEDMDKVYDDVLKDANELWKEKNR